jgi:transposase-like protein
MKNPPFRTEIIFRTEPLSTCQRHDCVADLISAWAHSWQQGYRAAVEDRHHADLQAWQQLVRELHLTDPMSEQLQHRRNGIT